MQKLLPSSVPLVLKGLAPCPGNTFQAPSYQDQHLGASPQAATALAHLNYYFGSYYSFLGPWKIPLLFCKLSSLFKRCVSYFTWQF